MRMTRAQAEAAGLEWRGKAPGGPARESQDSALARRLFLESCKAHGLPEPKAEYPFGEEIGRRWRFDWLFMGWLAVEIVGGIWTRGHHSRGRSQLDDMERRNAAQMMGYCVLEFSPQQVESGEAFAVIRKAFNLETP